MKLTFRIVFALFAATALSAGQTVAPALTEPAPTGASALNSTLAQVAQAKTPPPPKAKGSKSNAIPPDDPDEASKPYVIGALDVLQITVWNDPKLSAIYDVGPDGLVSMQLIGQFKADGLTQAQLIALIREKLAATAINDPEVNVQVLKMNSKKYYIYGGCARNGEFPLVGSMTFMDAFANCGGFKEFSNAKKIYILRGEQKIPFNYVDVSHGRHMEQNRRIRNGDRIFVP
jgi:polysaccharide export outer membrane protein